MFVWRCTRISTCKLLFILSNSISSYTHINIAPRKETTQGHENDTWNVSFPWSPRLRCEGCGPTPSNSQYRNDQPGVAWLVPGRFLNRSAWQVETNLVMVHFTFAGCMNTIFGWGYFYGVMQSPGKQCPNYRFTGKILHMIPLDVDDSKW